MQFDRLLNRAMTQIAPVLGARRVAAAPRSAPSDDDLRGSGSWANEWDDARAAAARGKTLVRRKPSGKTRRATATPEAEPVDTSLRVRPLMGARAVKLHNWIADRLEADAPDCTLHAGVALSAFLSNPRAEDGTEEFAGLVADLVIADIGGRPVCVLLSDEGGDPRAHLGVVQALTNGGVPSVEIPARPSLSKLWSEISACLPDD